MIVRSWRGSVRSEDGDRYYEYLQQTGLRAYRHTPGNKGVLALRRELGDRTEFLLLSFWESLDAAARFAGGDASNVIYYPADEELLVEYDHFVNHYEVLDDSIYLETSFS